MRISNGKKDVINTYAVLGMTLMSHCSSSFKYNNSLPLPDPNAQNLFLTRDSIGVLASFMEISGGLIPHLGPEKLRGETALTPFKFALYLQVYNLPNDDDDDPMMMSPMMDFKPFCTARKGTLFRLNSTLLIAKVRTNKLYTKVGT